MDYTGNGDKPGPRKVSAAPERYIELTKKNIIGFEIAIDRLEGKFKKMSGNVKGDRGGAIRGLQGLGSGGGKAMADWVQGRSDMKELARKKLECFASEWNK